MTFIYVYQDLFAEEWGIFFQVLETSEVSLRVENEKGHTPRKGGTHRGGISHLSWPGLLFNQNGDSVFFI